MKKIYRWNLHKSFLISCLCNYVYYKCRKKTDKVKNDLYFKIKIIVIVIKCHFIIRNITKKCLSGFFRIFNYVYTFVLFIDLYNGCYSVVFR